MRLWQAEVSRAKAFADYLPLPEDMPEAEFQRRVIQFAEAHGWLCCHTRRAVVRKGQWATPTSVKGWVDLVLVRRGTLVFAELKAKGRYPDPSQRAVLGALSQIPGATVAVWRPADWLDIRGILL